MRWILLALAFCGPQLHAQDDPAARLEEVLVVGEHPGPGLWKVSKRSHVLFVLGTHAPLPKDLVWRSKEVEAAIARSNEILGVYSVSLRVDLWCPDCAAIETSAGCERCDGKRTVRELFSAWLAVPPGVTAGEVLAPSVELPGMVEPVRFRVQLYGR